AMRGIDGQIVDVELGARLLELRQHVSGETADHRAFGVQRGDREEGIALEQLSQVACGGLIVEIGRRVIECAGKEAEHGAQDVCIAGSEDADLRGGIHHSPAAFSQRPRARSRARSAAETLSAGAVALQRETQSRPSSRCAKTRYFRPTWKE